MRSAAVIGFRVGLFLLLIGLALGAGISSAEGLKPKNFAYGLLLEPEGRGPVYGLRVPETVYQGAAQKNLTDVAVFDAEGRMLSHAVRRPRNALVQQEPVELPFFPLYEGASAEKAEILFLFGTDSAGAILRRGEKDKRTQTTQGTQRTGGEEGTQRTEPGNGMEDPVLYAYLADASRLDGGIDGLEVQWFGAEEAFITSVSVEGSDDLTRWRMLNRNATLADLNYRGHRLAEHRIPFQGKPVLNT